MDTLYRLIRDCKNFIEEKIRTREPVELVAYPKAVHIIADSSAALNLSLIKAEGCCERLSTKLSSVFKEVISSFIRCPVHFLLIKATLTKKNRQDKARS